MPACFYLTLLPFLIFLIKFLTARPMAAKRQPTNEQPNIIALNARLFLSLFTALSHLFDKVLDRSANGSQPANSRAANDRAANGRAANDWAANDCRPSDNWAAND